ncbi:hypothetical protein WHY35_06215 [Clostridium perfringens]|uniref:hypothetical protein n=1 Tax=Clostridium perfringens TaxID=1502 RepID=UPI0030CE398B
MKMTLSEAIKRLKIIAAYREAKGQNAEAEEALQLMNWLIELKDLRKMRRKREGEK